MSRETRVDHDYKLELLKNAGKKNHLPFSVVFLPPEIYILNLKNILASNLKQLYILGGSKYSLNLLSLSEEHHGKTSF